MKLTGIALVFIFAVMFSSCASGVKTVKNDDFTMEKYKRIAVLDFEGNNQVAGAALAESMVPALMEAGFEVMERSALEKLLKEQKLGLTGVVDSSQISRIGNLAGVNALILGNFHAEKKEKKRMIAVRKRRGIFRPRVAVLGRIETETVFNNISIRIVDVETGKVLLSSSSKNEIDVEDVDNYFDEVSKEIRKAAEK
ncbi:MAG: hypothetical protein A2231_06445 [Candidatus Firestonebacteria bacterium RIFOXYA2_FULL_40_8]|nr:MAG: hypothetical protein A2231_06445 [Candidatus Firestonebacteria bacterium RIFOXYA2_FULL_40_8]